MAIWPSRTKGECLCLSNCEIDIPSAKFVHIVFQSNLHFRPNGSMCQMDDAAQQIAAQCAYWLEGVLLVNYSLIY